MEGELARHAACLFGEAAARRAPDTAPTPRGEVVKTSAASGDTARRVEVPKLRLELSSRQERRLWRHVLSIEDFWQSLPELEPGTVARMGKIASDRHWEVIFLTKRPDSAGATAQLQTQRWLEHHGFPLPSVYVVTGSRGLIASALELDLVIDDRPENCLDVTLESKARAILVWRDDKKLLPATARRLGVGVVPSMTECLDILAKLDSATPDSRATVVERVVRALGFSAPEAGDGDPPLDSM